MVKVWQKILLIAAVLTLIACAYLFVACDDKGRIHEHVFTEWVVEEEPTCVDEGVEVSVCDICGTFRGRRPIAPLGHDFSVNVAIITPAKCEEVGVGTADCSRCGEHTNHLVIPATGHDWTYNIADYPDGFLIKTATCEEAGSYYGVCKTCGDKDVVEIPALGHNWQIDNYIDEPTCVDVGHVNRHCTRSGCDVAEVAEVPALGHSWEDDYTVDVEPWYDRVGSESIHCERCDATKDARDIPALVSTDTKHVEFYLVRNSGERLSLSGVDITVEDDEGNSASGKISNGVFSMTVMKRVYTVSVHNLPAGYTAEASYTLNPTQSFLNINLTGHLIDGEIPAGTRFAVGSPMYDFSITTISGETMKFSDILAGKKAVLINFWATWCMPCREEFPAMQAAYNNYADDIAILAIDPSGNDSAREVRRFFSEVIDLTQFATVAYDGNNAIFNGIGSDYYPTSIIVDSEGVISFLEQNAMNQAAFESLFAKYAG